MMKIYNTKLLLAGLLTLGVATGAAVGDTLEEIKEKGMLRVAVYKDYPPYSYLSKGSMQGVDVDIARALAERLGVGLSTMNITASDEAMEDDLRNAIWKGHYLGGGTADVMMHVPVDEAFAEENDQVMIFGPYYQEELAIARSRERLPELDSLLVFTRERIAVELETFPDTFLSTTEAGRLRSNVLHYKRVADACTALKAGEASALMAPRAQLEDCIGDQPDKFAISSLPVRAVRLFAWTVGMAVKADNAELRDALTEALETVHADGTLEAIFARHGVSYQAPPDLRTAGVTRPAEAE